MTQSEVLSVIKDCINPTAVCKVAFSYQQYEELMFPLMVSQDLFISVVDRDFCLDGYTIRRITDVKYAEAVRGTYLKIHGLEGNIKRLHMPPINITTLKTAISDIIVTGELIILEGIMPETSNKFILFGKPLNVTEKSLRFRSFDGGCNWSDKTLLIPFSAITSITFGSSYISTYAKYLKAYPEIR